MIHSLRTILSLISLVAIPIFAAPLHKRLTPIDSPFCLASDPCAGTNFNSSLASTYICGDFRLGPINLPSTIPLSSDVGDLVTPYQRFGGQCPGQFITQWWNVTLGSFNYPPKNGFSLDTAGNPVMGNITLTAGTLVDRFGSEFGNFLAPYASVYSQRSLPPSNLNLNPAFPLYPYNYHIYQVMKDLPAMVGPIAPWFGQPGFGSQFYTPGTSVAQLVTDGFLQRLTEFY